MPYSMIIEAGKLRHRIQLAQIGGVQDAFGGIAPDAGSVYATVRASIEALTGREAYAGQQLTAEVTHKITIRWMDGVKANHVVWFDTRQFQIQAVLNPDERHKMLILLCLERDDSSRELG